MKYANEKYVKKGMKLNELMYKECVDRLNDFNDIKESLQNLNKDLRNLENQTQGEREFSEFNNKLKEYSQQLEELDRFRMYIKLNNNELKEIVEKRELTDEKISLEQLEEFENKTRYLIDQVATLFDTLRPLKKEVDELKKQSSVNMEINHLMEDIYRHSSESQIRIEQLSEQITQNAKEGNMHDIIMANSLLKADIELLKKEANKR